MMDWIGSLHVREHSSRRVVLGLTQTTRVIGLSGLAAGIYLFAIIWPVSPMSAVIPTCLVMGGLILASLQRELVFDREDGVMRVIQRTLFLDNQVVVPLFHLRAVVIIARPGTSATTIGVQSRYIAYVERRVGDPIYIDESRRCAKLLAMAEAISEVAEVRLEYDAMSYVNE